MKAKSALGAFLAVAGAALASGTAFGWSKGHDTVAEAVRGHLSADQRAHLEDDGARKRYLAYSHLPDNRAGWTNVLNEAERAFLAANGVDGTYGLHYNRGYWSAFALLVKAIRENDVERRLLWEMAIGHAVADMGACNHDPLIHIADYGWGPGGAKVLPRLELDLGFVEKSPKTKDAFFRRAAALEPRPVAPDATLRDILLSMSAFENEGLSNFRIQTSLLQAAADYACEATDENAARLGELLGDLGLWAVDRTLYVCRAAELVARRNDDLAMDMKSLLKETNERWTEFTRTRPLADDEMARPFINDGKPSKIRVLYDPLGRYAAGSMTILDRFLAVCVAGSLREIAPKSNATLLDLRELQEKGVSPADAPLLVVFGTRLGDWGCLRRKQLIRRLSEYAQAGGRMVWIGGKIPEGIDDALAGAIRVVDGKDGYCKPLYPLPFDEYVASKIVWTGGGRRDEWKYERRPTGGAGWHWFGSHEYFDALPDGARPLLEIVPPSGSPVVYGAADSRVAFLPTAALYPYVLTDETPNLRPVSLRLDGAGERILSGAIRAMLGNGAGGAGRRAVRKVAD